MMWMRAVWCLLVASAAEAGAEEAWPLFPTGQVPGERPGTVGAEVHRDDPVDGLLYSNVSFPTLQPFLVPHDHPLNIGSAAVVAPGGAYEFLSWTKEGTDIAAWLNGLGISAFVLKYRVPARSWMHFGEPALIDAQRAMGLVRQSASKLGLNASRIGFVGFSAGGNLVGQLSTKYSQRAYVHIDDADDLSCRPDFSIFVYPWKLLRDDLRTLALPVTSQHPPAFLTQAADDETAHVETSVYYYGALKAAGAPPAEMHLYPAGGHGYGRCTVGASRKTAGAACCSWPGPAAEFMRSLAMAAKATGGDHQMLV